MLRGFLTQALGLVLNYIFTLEVVYLCPVGEAGRVFWYLHLLFAFSLLVAWGADSWLVQAVATSSADMKQAIGAATISTRSVRLSSTLLAALAPILFIYIIFIEGDGILFAAIFLSTLLAYTATSLLSVISEGMGRKSLSMYHRAVAPYIFSAPGLWLINEIGIEITLEIALTIIALSCVINAFIPKFWPTKQFELILPSFVEVYEDLRRFAPNMATSMLSFISAWYALLICKLMLNDAEIAQVSFIMRVAAIVSVPMIIVGVTFSRPMARAQTRLELRHLYIQSALVSFGMATIAFFAVAFGAEIIFSYVKSEYRLHRELVLVMMGHWVLMAFGAQFTLLAMSGRVSLLNRSMSVTVFFGSFLVASLTYFFGLFGMFLGVALVMAIKPIVIMYYIIPILRK